MRSPALLVKLTATIAILLSASTFPAAGAEPSIPDLFRLLTKSTRWIPVDKIKINFPTYHPQGMTLVNDRIFLSSVEVIDRGKQLGRGHLFELKSGGDLRRSITLGEGPAYHPGGIDYDGRSIWIPVAEYRPDSTSIVYTLDPETMNPREVFRFDDHLGAIAHSVDRHELIAVSWGSRRIYRWAMENTSEGYRPVDAANPEIVPNPNHYIDYQDLQMISGSPYLLCAGLNRYGIRGRNGGGFGFGGIDLLDVDTLRPLHMLPVSARVDQNLVVTQNPFYVQRIESGLRFYFAPEDDETTIYVFEPRLSPGSP